MEEIVFSVFEPGQEAFANLETLLKQFERERQIRVRLEVIPWSDGWKRQMDSAIYSTGPDISHTGSTWVQDLARMNALRPFSRNELNKIIGEKDYFEPSWSGARTSESDNGPVTWAIPFVNDVRVVYFRRDLLEQAGLGETTAFQDIPHFDASLAKLNTIGIEQALAMSTLPANVNLQNLASWIWNAGGGFFNPDGTKLAFDAPEALNGMKAYFRLGRYLGNTRLNQGYSDNVFETGRAAVLMSGYINLADIPSQVVRDNLGIASVLGTSFVGPDDLVIWQHSRHPDAALALIQFLSRVESGKFLSPSMGLPPYRDGWKQAPFNGPAYTMQMNAMQAGRSFPDSRLWALVEKRLSDLIPEIWTSVFAGLEKSDEIVEREITTLAKRLRLTLES